MTIAPSHVTFTPPLIDCLATLSRLHGEPVTVSSLEAGLPRNGQTPTVHACIRTARRQGLSARIVHKPDLTKISALSLPCVLLLQDDQACILTSLTGQTAGIISSETPEARCEKDIQDITPSYTGYAVFARPKATPDNRSARRQCDSRQWFWGTLRHFFPVYQHVALASVFINILAIATSVFTLNVYDRVVPNNALETLWVLAIGVGLAIFFDFLLRNLRGYFVDVAGRNADILIASRLMEHLLSIRMDHKPDSTGALANTMREVDALREFFSSTTLLAVLDLPFLLLFILLIALIGGPVAIIPAIAAPIVILTGLFVQGPLRRVIEDGYKDACLKNALLVEAVSGLETIKASRAEGQMLGRWEQLVGASARATIKARALSSFSMNFTHLASQLVMVGQVIWGVYLIGDGRLTVGGLIACSILAGRAMNPLGAIAAMLTRLQQSRMALSHLDKLMQLPTERPVDAGFLEYTELRATVDLEKVTFSYPAAQTTAVSEVSFHIAEGERVAIIGKTGSGKTTLGKLVTSLYTPQFGTVKIGGVDIRQIDPADLRHRIGYLPQDNFLFSGTVRENIILGAPPVSDQTLVQAATIAGVTDFLKNQPAGFNLQVGERGQALSGGQRQAVTIARTLLLDPDILILDEPSSSMDIGSEAALKLRLSTILQNKTLILITHRPSLLSLATRIIALENGRIVADGPRNEILKALQHRGKDAHHA